MSYYDEVDYALATLNKEEQDMAVESRVNNKEYIYTEEADVWQCCFCGAHADKIENVKHYDTCKEELYDYNE